MGRLARQAGRDVPAARRRHAGADRHLLAAVARVVLRGDLGDLSSQLERPAPWLFAGRRCAALGARCAPPAPPAIAAAGAAARDGERRRRLHAGRARIRRRPRWRPRDAAALVERDGQSRVRHHRERVRRPRSPGPEQPRESADAVRQRSGRPTRPARRSTCATRSRARCGARRRGHCRGAPDAGRWVIRHAAGVTRYQHAVAGLRAGAHGRASRPTIRSRSRVLTLTNTSRPTRHLSVFGYVEWCLGPPRAGERRFVVTEMRRRRPARFSRATPTTPSSRIAWRSGTRPSAPRSFTCDRAEFVGRNRTLERAGGAASASGSAAAPAPVSIRAPRCRSIVGSQPGRVATRRVRARPGTRPRARASTWRRATRSLAAVRRRAIARASASGTTRSAPIQVHTPDDSFDLIVNRWLLYQTLSCRIWARSGPYQPAAHSASAISSRTCWRCSTPGPSCAARTCCGRRRGSSSKATCSTGGIRRAGRGTRTRCSDDLLWLPYAVAAYVSHTGDESVLDEVGAVPRGAAARAGPGGDLHAAARSRARRASLFEHCVRAIDRMRMKYGAHGLPLIGSGDWNDGMNRVGHEGRGESVWLGWFLVDRAERLRRRSASARQRSDLAQRYRERGARGSPACWSSRGTATGIGAPTSTTARRSDRCRTRSARSIR